MLVAFGGFTVIHAVGLTFGSPILSYAEVSAWAALFAYAVLAGRTVPPRVHLALFCGLLALGLPAGAEFLAHGASLDAGGGYGESAGWFAYWPAPRPPNLFETLGLRPWQLALLPVGYAGLTVAVFGLPGRRSARTALVGGLIGGALAIGYAGLRLWSQGSGEWRGQTTALLVSLTLTVVVFAAAGAALARGGQRLAGLGLALGALAIVEILDRALAWWAFSPYGSSRAGVTITVAVAVAGPGTGYLHVADAVFAVVRLLGAMLVAVGCLWTAGRTTGRTWWSFGERNRPM
ncbi:hypothetical protein GCM10027290_07000 [Micromonospora sonneratiae]